MNDNITVTCDDNEVQNSKEFIFNIQKAMLATLFENNQINQFQYEYAVELLEKNFRKR